MALRAANSALKKRLGDNWARITLEPNFDFLSAEYAQLLAASEATAFQSAEWLHSFYSTLVPALDVDPLIVTMRDPDTDKLLLVLPLVRQSAMGAKLIQPADLGVSDYNAVIAAPETLQRLRQDHALTDMILDELQPFDALFFRKQRADGFCVSQLFRKAVVSPNENAAYDIEIDSDYETWLAQGVSKKFRKSVRSKQRKFEAAHGPLSFTCAKTPDEIDAAFAFMRKSREERFENDLFCQDEYYAFYREFAVMSAKDGGSFVHVCKAEGKIAAVEFGLAKGEASHLIHGAFDMQFGAYSPGNLSLVNLIRDRLELGHRKFDFTIGDHEYKSRFNARKTELYNAVLANGPLGQLVGVTYRHAGGVKRLLTKMNPQLN